MEEKVDNVVEEESNNNLLIPKFKYIRIDIALSL